MTAIGIAFYVAAYLLAGLAVVVALYPILERETIDVADPIGLGILVVIWPAIIAIAAVLGVLLGLGRIITWAKEDRRGRR